MYSSLKPSRGNDGRLVADIGDVRPDEPWSEGRQSSRVGLH